MRVSAVLEKLQNFAYNIGSNKERRYLYMSDREKVYQRFDNLDDLWASLEE